MEESGHTINEVPGCIGGTGNRQGVYGLKNQQSQEAEKNQKQEIDLVAEEEKWEEDQDAEPAKPWVMVAIVTGMLVLAGIICAILWHFTHLDGEDRPDQESTAYEETNGSGQDTDSQIGGPGPGGQDADGQDGEGLQSEGQDTGSQGADSQDVSDQENGSQGTDVADGGNPGTDGSGQGVGTETQNPDAEGTGSTGSKDPGTETPSQPPKTDAGTQDPVSGDKTMTFNDVQESVTPKDVINLRSVPSTADAATVVTQVANGVTLSRTGINGDTGWSRIEYNGQILYGVSQYLTTDLSYKPPVQPSDPNRVSTKDGRVIIFTDCNDNVTPKEYVNLRTEPSTTEGEATISCQLNGGEVAQRTRYCGKTVSWLLYKSVAGDEEGRIHV